MKKLYESVKRMAQPLVVGGILLASVATRPFFDGLEQSRYETQLRNAYVELTGREVPEETDLRSLEDLARRARVNVDSIKNKYGVKFK